MFNKIIAEEPDVCAYYCGSLDAAAWRLGYAKFEYDDAVVIWHRPNPQADWTRVVLPVQFAHYVTGAAIGAVQTEWLRHMIPSESDDA